MRSVTEGFFWANRKRECRCRRLLISQTHDSRLTTLLHTNMIRLSVENEARGSQGVIAVLVMDEIGIQERREDRVLV